MMGVVRRIGRFINHLSLGQKVMSLIIVELISYSMVTTIALSQIRAVGQEVRQMADLYLPLFSTTDSVRQHILKQKLNVKEIINVGDRVVYDKGAEEAFLIARDQYRAVNGDIYDDIAFSTDLITRFGGESGAILIGQFRDRLIQRLNDINEANKQHNIEAEKIFDHVENGSFLMGLELLTDMTARERTLTETIDRLVGDLNELKQTSVAYADQVEHDASSVTIVVAVATICIGIGMIFFIVKRNISRPLHQLTETIEAFNTFYAAKESADEQDLMARGDELGMVSRSFNRLKKDLIEQGLALRAAKDEAERVNRAKTQFLAAASHDLRQPLHAMQMYIAALKGTVSDKAAHGIIEDIEMVSVTTGRLLNALLDVSQLEAGSVKIQRTDFSVQEVLARAARGVLPIALKNGLDLRVVPSNAIVRSDPDLLERILGNFVTNAVSYTESGRVLIGCRRRGDQLAIQVWDTGPGIPLGQLEAIFDDFHQLDSGTKKRGRGIGLGLAIVRRLAVILGHKTEVWSELGKGSCFSIVVDQTAKRDETEATTKQLTYVPGQFHESTIVIIEDDVIVLDATQKLLESWGCQVIGAKSTDEALSKLNETVETPDLIIADYRLQEDITGAEAITRIQVVLGIGVPAIILTGELDPRSIQELTRSGYKVLQKPVRPAKLRTLIRYLLDQHEITVDDMDEAMVENA